ncbi:MAG TPA: hypothetical protein VJP80_05620 [Candidatus Saccharimonadales bacterium]|nr:hypothetical protein [Candidatus Saccharimonadales bacterium]
MAMFSSEGQPLQSPEQWAAVRLSVLAEAQPSVVFATQPDTDAAAGAAALPGVAA